MVIGKIKLEDQNRKKKVQSWSIVPSRQITVKILIYFLPEFLPALYFLHGCDYTQIKHYSQKQSPKCQIWNLLIPSLTTLNKLLHFFVVYFFIYKMGTVIWISFNLGQELNDVMHASMYHSVYLAETKCLWSVSYCKLYTELSTFIEKKKKS